MSIEIKAERRAWSCSEARAWLGNYCWWKFTKSFQSARFLSDFLVSEKWGGGRGWTGGKEKKNLSCCLVTVDHCILFFSSWKEMLHSLYAFWVDAFSSKDLYVSCTLSVIIIIITASAHNFQEVITCCAWYTLHTAFCLYGYFWLQVPWNSTPTEWNSKKMC